MSYKQLAGLCTQIAPQTGRHAAVPGLREAVQAGDHPLHHAHWILEKSMPGCRQAKAACQAAQLWQDQDEAATSGQAVWTERVWTEAVA